MTRQARRVEGAQFVQWFGPVLDALRALGGSGTPDEVVDHIANTLKIPDEQLNETLPSGDLRFRNQVQWARFYLTREGLLDSSRRGIWSLTEKGRSTTLTLEEARAIFRKLVRFFQDERKKRKATLEPAEEQAAEESAAIPSDYREQLLGMPP